MATPPYRHLMLARQEPVNPRRRRGGRGTPIERRDDVGLHAEKLLGEMTGAEAILQQKKPSNFDPGLVVRLKIQPDTVDDKILRSLGIEFISQEESDTLVVFVDEAAKREFLARLARFRVGETGRDVSARLFHAIEEVGRWSRSDRVGRSSKR